MVCTVTRLYTVKGEKSTGILDCIFSLHLYCSAGQLQTYFKSLPGIPLAGYFSKEMGVACYLFLFFADLLLFFELDQVFSCPRTRF